MSNKQFHGLNQDGISITDINRLEQFCYEGIRQDELYDIRNSAKLRAVTSSKSYEEFKDIVDAAHLRPLDKFDKQNAETKNRLWNNAARN